jgi:hypothetical protein
MIKKKGLSYEEHLNLARRLKAACSEIMKISLEVGHSYPLHSKAYLRSVKAMEACDSLRGVMDNQLATEHPNEKFQGVYFGPQKPH